MRDWERISELVPHSYGWKPVWYMCSYMCAGLLDKAGNSYATSSQASMAWVPERGYCQSESKAVEQPGHMGACLWCPHHVWEMSLADPPRCQQSSILGNEGLLPLSGLIFPSLCHDTIVQILSPPPSPWSDLRNGLDIGSLMMLESPSAQTCSLSSHVDSWLLFFSWNPPVVLPVPSQARIKTSNIQKPLALKHLCHFRFSSISIHVGWETIHSVTVVWYCHCQLFYGSCKILIKWMKYTIWDRWSIPQPPTELGGYSDPPQFVVGFRTNKVYMTHRLPPHNKASDWEPTPLHTSPRFSGFLLCLLGPYVGLTKKNWNWRWYFSWTRLQSWLSHVQLWLLSTSLLHLVLMLLQWVKACGKRWAESCVQRVARFFHVSFFAFLKIES